MSSTSLPALRGTKWRMLISRIFRLLFICASALFAIFFPANVHSQNASELFRSGSALYQAGDYAKAAEVFSQSVSMKPASGTLQNLGNAQWQSGFPGAAILAWEQSLWLDPFGRPAHNNLRFARRTAQLEAPDLSWYEVVSTWLPVNWWAWITGSSFWLAIAASLVPGILRWEKAGWHQAVAALALTVFLLSLPAHAGVHTRSRIGFAFQKDTPLRLTPTAEAQLLARLPSGEPARLQRVQGNYLLVHTPRATGWVEKSQFGFICPRARS